MTRNYGLLFDVKYRMNAEGLKLSKEIGMTPDELRLSILEEMIIDVAEISEENLEEFISSGWGMRSVSMISFVKPVPVRTVKAWELGIKSPTDMENAYLFAIAQFPEECKIAQFRARKGIPSIRRMRSVRGWYRDTLSFRFGLELTRTEFDSSI